MKTVYKYRVDGATEIRVPVGSKVIHVGMQNGAPYIWVEVSTNPHLDIEGRYFEIAGTGWEIEDDAVHIGSVIDGAFVWHIYEVQG